MGSDRIKNGVELVWYLGTFPLFVQVVKIAKIETLMQIIFNMLFNAASFIPKICTLVCSWISIC